MEGWGVTCCALQGRENAFHAGVLISKAVSLGLRKRRGELERGQAGSAQRSKQAECPPCRVGSRWLQEWQLAVKLAVSVRRLLMEAAQCASAENLLVIAVQTQVWNWGWKLNRAEVTPRPQELGSSVVTDTAGGVMDTREQLL